MLENAGVWLMGPKNFEKNGQKIKKKIKNGRFWSVKRPLELLYNGNYVIFHEDFDSSIIIARWFRFSVEPALFSKEIASHPSLRHVEGLTRFSDFGRKTMISCI